MPKTESTTLYKYNLKTAMRFGIIIGAYCLLSIGCQQPEPGNRSEIRTGMTRVDVRKLLGVPTETKTIVKQTEYIWGPQEEWWDHCLVCLSRRCHKTLEPLYLPDTMDSSGAGMTAIF